MSVTLLLVTHSERTAGPWTVVARDVGLRHFVRLFTFTAETDEQTDRRTDKTCTCNAAYKTAAQ